MDVKSGDRIRIKTESRVLEGILIPTPELLETDSITIKLDNGYNVGVLKNKIRSTTILKKHKTSTTNKEKVAQDKTLPTISILHTGGTIASKVDYETGGVQARFTPEELLMQFPELKKIANIRSRLMRNMWSEDMRFDHYNLMADEVKKEIDAGSAGVIITHGTDTMHFSSAALSFIMKDSSFPVLFVGAQRSSDRGSSDAGMNLICAARFLVDTDFGGIGICMHKGVSDDACVILPGTRTRKMHTSRRDAFQAINDLPIADVEYPMHKIIFHSETYKRRSNDKFKMHKFKPDLKVGMIKAHPNMYPQEISCYKGFDGVVLEGTGLGQFPVSSIDEFTAIHEKIFSEIEKLIKAGTIAVMAPQTIFGRIQMNVYAPARKLQKIGVLGNYCDMTPETAFIKLSWLLSNFTKAEAKEKYPQNITGEIKESINPDMFIRS